MPGFTGFRQDQADTLADNAVSHRVPEARNEFPWRGSPSTAMRGWGIVQVQNKTLPQLAVPIRGILQLGNYVDAGSFIEPLFYEHPVFEAKQFNSSLTPPAIITLQPLQPDEVGAALIHGVIECKINIVDEDHRFCLPTTNVISLNSNHAGDIEILWAEGGTGEKNGLVKLGDALSSRAGAIVRCQADEDFTINDPLVNATIGLILSGWTNDTTIVCENTGNIFFGSTGDQMIAVQRVPGSTKYSLLNKEC